MSGRPSVSVVVPFLGGAEAAARLRANLDLLAVDEGDEVIVADNNAEPAGLDGQARIVAANAEESPFHARNVGARTAANEWLLFMDADCRPRPDLLDAYFSVPVDGRCGILAGSVRGLDGQPGLTAAYARSRRMLSEEFHVEARPEWPHPAGITGNLMVRRRAWEAVGGFQEGLRAGADVEFCWRVQEAGWALAHVPAASVEHAHVTSLRALLRQASTHGSGMQWVNRRYPGSFPGPALGRALLRSAVGAIAWPLALQPRRGLFKLIDGAWTAAYAHGYLVASNRARRRAPVPGPSECVGLTGEYPAPAPAPKAPGDEPVRVEALTRAVAARPARDEAPAVVFAEDDPPLARLSSLLWALARHPLRCARAGRGERETRLAALAPAARRAARERRRGARLVVLGEDPGLRRLLALAGLQRASTRWRTEPRADA